MYEQEGKRRDETGSGSVEEEQGGKGPPVLIRADCHCETAGTDDGNSNDDAEVGKKGCEESDGNGDSAGTESDGESDDSRDPARMAKVERKSKATEGDESVGKGKKRTAEGENTRKSSDDSAGIDEKKGGDEPVGKKSGKRAGEKGLPRVVVVGGGFAGAHVAKGLEKKARVTLIEPKPYWQCTPSLPWLVADPAHAEAIRAPLESFLPNTRLVADKAARATHRSITTEEGRSFKFDFLVVCTGSRYPMPFEVETGAPAVLVSGMDATGLIRSAELLEEREGLGEEGRTNVVVVGGGPTGVEITSEVARKYAHASVTLVHSGPALMHRSCKGAGTKAAAHFRKCKNVQVVLDDRVEAVRSEEAFGSVAVCRSGRELPCDLLFYAVGFSPNTAFLAEKSFGEAMTERGLLQVNDHLQVRGYERIFAAGDITAIPEEKLGQNAQRHSTVVVHNIGKLIAGSTKLKTYSKSFLTSPFALVGLGRARALMVRGDKVYLDNFAVPKMKAAAEWKMMKQYGK